MILAKALGRFFAVPSDIARAYETKKAKVANRMIIGVIKEIMRGEKRVSATPDTVRKLTLDGAAAWVQAGAGLGANFDDAQYIAAGARMVTDPQEIYAGAEVILKVKEPQHNSDKNLHEVDMMRAGQVLITFLHPASPANHKMVRDMAAKGIIGLTLDGLPRTPRAERMDPLITMSKIGGYKGILMAANELPRFASRMVTPVSASEPINVLVVGVGMAGLAALATAKQLGANLYAADIRPSALEMARVLGAEAIGMGVPVEVAEQGGHAQNIAPEWTDKGRAAIAEALPKMDIVYLSALVPSKMAPVLITEEMVGTMKYGSVIVDLSIDQGGNCALTPQGAKGVFHGVTIFGIKNIPGLLPESSSAIFAENVYNLVHYLMKDGQIALDMEDAIVRGILTTYGGDVVHQGTIEAMAAVGG